MDPSWRPRDRRGREDAYGRPILLVLVAMTINTIVYNIPMFCGLGAIPRQLAQLFKRTPPLPYFGTMLTYASYDAATDRLTLHPDPLTRLAPPPGTQPNIALRAELSAKPFGVFFRVFTRYSLESTASPTPDVNLPAAVLERARTAHLAAIAAAAVAPTPSPQMGEFAPIYLRASKGPSTAFHPLGLILNLVVIAAIVDTIRIDRRRALTPPPAPPP